MSVFHIRSFKALLLLLLFFSSIFAAEYKCKTECWVKDTAISNIELERLQNTAKFLLNNLPDINELLNNELNKASSDEDIKNFVKKYSIYNALLNLVAKQQPKAFVDISISAKVILNEYCQKHKIDLKDLINQAKNQNIQEANILDFFVHALMKNKIIAGTVPTFMIRAQNDLEKILIPQPGYKVSDIRIVYEEFSINKNYPNAYSLLLQTRAGIMEGYSKKCPKNVTSTKQTHYHYTSGVNWDMKFQVMLYDLSAGNVSTIFEKDDKFCFVKLINYEVLGNDKNLINQVYTYYQALALAPYSEKFFFDLVNYIPIN